MSKKFYVVWVGRETGIFTSWDHTKKLVDKYPKARYKSFKTQAEAEAAFAGAPGRSAMAKNSPSRRKPAASSSTKSAANPTTNKKFDVEIYTDGGCEPNPGKAGSGVAVYRACELSELWYGLYNPDGTNNSAELNALNQALLIAKENIAEGRSVHIRSDSQYSINCITNWAYSWKKKGWKRQKPGDIKNLEVIQQAHELFDQLKNKLELSHVKAHIGIEGNELADRMSIYAIDKKDSDFCLYSEPLDLQNILALRAG